MITFDVDELPEYDRGHVHYKMKLNGRPILNVRMPIPVSDLEALVAYERLIDSYRKLKANGHI